MRRTTWAVASDKDLGRKTLLRQWDRCEEVDEMLIDVHCSSLLVDIDIAFNFSGKRAKTNAPRFGVVLCDCDWFVSYTSICF